MNIQLIRVNVFKFTSIFVVPWILFHANANVNLKFSANNQESENNGSENTECDLRTIAQNKGVKYNKTKCAK